MYSYHSTLPCHCLSVNEWGMHLEHCFVTQRWSCNMDMVAAVLMLIFWGLRMFLICHTFRSDFKTCCLHWTGEDNYYIKNLTKFNIQELLPFNVTYNLSVCWKNSCIQHVKLHLNENMKFAIICRQAVLFCVGDLLAVQSWQWKCQVLAVQRWQKCQVLLIIAASLIFIACLVEIIQSWFFFSAKPLWRCINVKVIETTMSIYPMHKSTVMPSLNAIA